jgi:hypothetical protein
VKTKLCKAVFSAVFVIALIIPLVSTDLRNGVVSQRENRILADRPPLSSMNHPRAFIQKFTQWYNDHVGLREKFLTLYQMINRQGPQYKEGILTYVTGKDGHHFFTGISHELIAKFQGRPVFSDEQLETFAKKLTAIKNYLDERGIPLILMFCTDKEAVYPEYYPETVLRGPESIQLDLITDYLKKNSSADVFNIREALAAQKGRYLLYPKAPPGDLAHYNEIGAFFAYRELMKHINVYFPEIVPCSLDNINIDCDKNGTASITFKKKPAYKKLDESFFDNVTVNRPFSWENMAFENTGTGSLTALFLRDSYSGFGADDAFFSKYVAQNFSKTIMIHYNNTHNLKQYIDTFRPGIVVFESTERALVYFLYCILQLDL